MTEFIAKFKCQGECGKNKGLMREKGARACKDCGHYFLCWPCNKTHKFTKGKFGLCNECAIIPKKCDQEGCNNEVPFGTCRSCWAKKDVVDLPDDEEIIENTNTQDLE